VNYDLIINGTSTEVTLALLKNKKLIELHKEKYDTDFNVGDVYLGKIRKIVPSLNAAFVDVGYEKDAFLHYLDLGPQFNSMDNYVQGCIAGKWSTAELDKAKSFPDIDKNGKIKDLLSGKQLLAVQVAKEPISSKGPRLSAEITLPGRYIVLVPFNDKISVSQKIKNPEERDRLIRLMQSIKPKNFGVIIRTVAENKKVAELDQDLRDLVEKWEKMFKNLRNAAPPKRVLGEMSRATTILRDLLTEKFTSIHIDDVKLYEEIKSYVHTIAPEKESIIKHFKGKIDIFEHFGIHRQIKASFGKKVMLPSGAYLIIEHTEAMHVIDVNSGGRKPSEQNQEQNALETNMEVAEEIARILRLRDMGGIICIDFIDMHEKENNRVLFEKFKEHLASDRAKHNVAQPSKFGVIEMTRQRVRPETDIQTTEVCPSCNGTGEISASILIVDEIANQLRYLFEDLKKKNVTLQVNPIMESYLKKGVKSHQMKWLMKYKKWVKIKGISTLPFLKFQFVDSENETIVI
jgi:ribonuclease G